MKRLFITLAILFTALLNAQTTVTTTHDKVKIKHASQAVVTDTILAIDSNGVIVKTNKILSDLALGGAFEVINEGSGNGIVEANRVAANFGIIGLDAIDFSKSSGISSTRGATGDKGVTFGLNNINPYTRTIMYGIGNTGASTLGSGDNLIGGENSFFYNNLYSNILLGENSSVGTVGAPLLTAVVYNSIVQGKNNNIYAAKDGLYVGVGLLSGSAGSSILGVANRDLTINNATSTGVSIDGYKPRFSVGVGTVTYNDDIVLTRANGLVVMSNGLVTAPEQTIAMINTPTVPATASASFGTRVVLTREYGEATYATLASYGGTGFENNLIPTLIPVSNTYYKISGTTINTNLVNFTHSSNRLTYTGTTTKEFNLNAFFTILTPVSGISYSIKFSKNGIIIGNPVTLKAEYVGGVLSSSIIYNVSLATNDYIEVFIANKTDTTNITVQNLFFNINSQ